MPTPKIVYVNLQTLTEGALLLALDELLQGRPDRAREVLLATKTTVSIYQRARGEKAVAVLRRMARAAEGEWP